MFKLDKSQGLGLVRHFLTLGGGALVANGVLSSEMATQGSGLLLGLIGLAWSMLDKTGRTAEVGQLQEDAAWLNDELETLRGENNVLKSTAKVGKERYSTPPPAKSGGFVLSKKSRSKLQGVHPVLCQIMETALDRCAVDFSIIEGVRSPERQAELVAANKSWVTVSKHQPDPETGLGMAVDVMALVDNKGSWEWPHYEKINEAVQEAAKIHNARVTWGGSWGVKDGGHIQLDGLLEEEKA